MLSHAEARLCWVHPMNKLGWVASVSPHYRSMVAHIRGRQGEERLACLIRRNGCNASRAEVRVGRLRFTPLMVGTSVRAAVAAVRAGSNLAGVCILRTVWVGLVAVFFGIIAAARAGGTALLTGSDSTRSPGLSTRRLAQFGGLLGVSWRGAAAGSRAG